MTNLTAAETETATVTVRILAHRVDWLRAVVATVAKKRPATGLRVERVGEPYRVTRTTEDGSYAVAMVEVDVAGEAPHTPGYRLVAKIDHVTAAAVKLNIVTHPCGGELPEEQLEQLRTCAPRCTHCGVTRSRHTTWLLRCEATGADVYVGSACLREFVRGGDVEGYLSSIGLFAEVAAAGDEASEFGGGGRGAESTRDVLSVLMTSARVLRANKFQTPRTEDDKEAFYTTVSHVLWPAPGSQHKVVLPPVEQFDIDLAEEALAFCLAGGANSYRANLQTYAKLGVVGYKGFRLMASAAGAALRERLGRQERQEQQARLARRERQHVGEVGKKLIVAVQVMRRFGMFQILTTADGDSLTVRSRVDSLPGTWMLIETTVKAHGRYRDAPQTEVKGVKWFRDFTGLGAREQAAAAAEAAQTPKGRKALVAAVKASAPAPAVAAQA